jgi:hypothetical protein
MKDNESYFKRGARIKPARRAAITAAAIVNPPITPTEVEAYKLAMANLHKPWARRYLRGLYKASWY